MGCDSIATTISRMGKEPTTLGPEDLKGHRFSAVLAKPSGIVYWFFELFLGACPKYLPGGNGVAPTLNL